MLDRPAFEPPPLHLRRLRSQGPRPRLCQWIEGEPSRLDTCKCGARAAPASSYCEPHRWRAQRSPDAILALPRLPAMEAGR